MTKPFFTAEDFKIEWEAPDGVRFDATSKTGARIAEGIATIANAKVAPLIAENEILKQYKMETILSNRVRDLEKIVSIMKEALELVLNHGPEWLIVTAGIKEMLAKCKELEK